MSARAWQEKETAISFAKYYACISDNTRRDLLRFYPNISPQRAIVAHCGVDREIFSCPDPETLADFKNRFQIEKPYFLTVGSRSQAGGYKNGALLFKAARKMKEKFEILCVGGGAEIPKELRDILPRNVSARRIRLEDHDLACAYAGALALVYPSLYEGFGMPPVEAMACGCPVITTARGSLREVCDEAALYISGEDETELCERLESVMDPKVRTKLVDCGLRRAADFSWDDMAQKVRELLDLAHGTRNDGGTRQFLEQWKRLRYIQSQVDVGL
jgi:glycosyltransferase involved in cell wall biosynthesis